MSNNFTCHVNRNLMYKKRISKLRQEEDYRVVISFLGTYT